MTILEELHTPVRHTCDVLVAGGGIAGISAALSAARAGADVMLLEREYMLGGLATAGMVNIYLPLDDGMGHQASCGIAEELLRLALPDMLLRPSREELDLWLSPHSAQERAKGLRYRIDFNPWLYAIACERLLRESGVRLLYGVMACGVHREDAWADAVICEGKDGRFAIRADSFVDATGDADILRLAGADTALYPQGNQLAAWYGFTDGAGQNGVKIMGVCDASEEEQKEGKTVEQLVDRRFAGVSAQELSEVTELAHRQIYRDVLAQRAKAPGYDAASIPVIPQMRMTRRLCGLYDMTKADDHRDLPDSVGLIGSWRMRGPAFAVPLRSLYGAQLQNVLAAGRCISTTDAMWDLTRVIPACAVTGEAAGLAAAMTDDLRTLDVGALQAKLRARGIPLTMAEAGII